MVEHTYTAEDEFKWFRLAVTLIGNTVLDGLDEIGDGYSDGAIGILSDVYPNSP